MKSLHYIGLLAIGLCCTSISLVAQSSGSSMDSDNTDMADQLSQKMGVPTAPAM